MPATTDTPERIQLEGLSGRAKRGPDQLGRWYWTARWTDDAGSRHEKVLGWMERPDAVRKLAALLASDMTKEVVRAVRSEITTVEDMMSRWLAHQEMRAEAGEIRAATLHQYRYAAGYGVGYLGDVRVEALTSDVLHDTLLKLRAGLAPRTVRMIGVMIAMSHDWALERGHIPAARPVRVHMSAPTVRVKLTPKAREIEAVIAQLTGWQRSFVALCAATGARPGEVQILRREHVEVGRDGWGIIHIPDEPGAKTGARDVPVPPWAITELRPLLDRAPEAGLFPIGARVSVTKTFKRLGVKWRLYGLRRAAATALASTPGVTMAALSAIMGHSAQVSVAIYQDRDMATLKAAARSAGMGRRKAAGVHHLSVAGDTSRGQVDDLPDGDE